MTYGHVSRPRSAALLAVVLLGGLLVGCGKDAPEAAPTPLVSPTTAPPPPAAPKVGECRDLSFAMAARPTSSARPIDCKRRHSAQTIHVGRVNIVEDGHLVAVDSDKALDQVARSCPRHLADHLGGDTEARRLSRFETVWFSPTLGQADRGSTWYRCDLVALAGRDRLLPLPRRTRGFLDRPDALDDYGTCGTTSPERPAFVKVACSRRHTWRAVATVDLVPGARYLGKAAGEQADDECRDIAADSSDFALQFTWSFEWPNRDLWDEGQRWGWCWLPDAS